MSDLEEALADHFDYERAVELAWRRARRSEESILSFGTNLGWVRENYTESIDVADLRREIDRRWSRTRARPNRRRPRGSGAQRQSPGGALNRAVLLSTSK